MSDLLAPPTIVLRRRSTMKALALDPARELGAGGEARVLALPGDDSLAAKLYHHPTPARARKVALMMEEPPELDASAARLAWPCDVLSDGRGAFAGFLMPRVEGPRVFELYNPAERRHAAPLGDYALLHRVGANVAAAFEALHARGYVIGDVNESNLLVDADASVTLVDTDSLQVRDPADGTVHRSRVGKAEFTPPELQGRPFGDFDRTPEHDRFGLAVLLFLLLMEGTHPFAGRMADGSEAPPVEERIRRGLFPHGVHGEIHPPKLAPEIDLLHPALRSLFVRAFVDGHLDPAARPTAAEWRAALAAAQAELATCAESAYHRFGAHLDRCPWCERAALLGGRDPFPADARPAPERGARGASRKGAPPPVPALAAAPARSAARMPAPAAPVPAPAPAAIPLAPVFGPSGVQHPAAWIAPILTLMTLGPAEIRMLCVGALFVAVAWWWPGSRPGERVDRHTAVASVAMLLMALALVGIARAGADEPSDVVAQAPSRGPAPSDVKARLVSTSAPTEAGARVELRNGPEIERELAARLFHAGVVETRGVAVTVRVRPDGTVEPQWMEPSDEAHRDFVTVAAPTLVMMRFRPLTGRDGSTRVEVRVEMEYGRLVTVPDR